MSKNEFPMSVHYSPGKDNAGKINGRLETVASEVVNNQAELDEALADGWSTSVPAAVAERLKREAKAKTPEAKAAK